MSRHLKLVVNPHEPWLHNLSGTDCDGVLCPLLKYFSVSLNFSYNFVDGTAIGDEMLNKSWTGFMGMLQSKQGDLVLGPVPYWDKPFVANITDYSVPFSGEIFTVFLHRSTYYTSGIFSFLSSLNWMVWSMLFAWMFIMLLLIIFIYITISSEHDLTPNHMLSFSNMTLMQYFGTDASYDKKFFRSLPMIVFFVFILLLLGILTSEVSSELTSQMSLKLPNEKINSIEDLAKSKKKVLFLEFLKNKNLVNEGPVMDRIVDKAIKDNTVIEWRDFLFDYKWINGVTDGRYAMFMFEVPFKQVLIRSTQLRPDQNQRPINYMYIEEYVKNIQTVLPFRRDLDRDLKWSLNHKLSQYISTGIIDHQLKASLKKSDQFFAFDYHLEDNEFRSLCFEDYKGVVMLFHICLFVGLIVFTCEAMFWLLFTRIQNRIDETSWKIMTPANY